MINVFITRTLEEMYSQIVHELNITALTISEYSVCSEARCCTSKSTHLVLSQFKLSNMKFMFLLALGINLSAGQYGPQQDEAFIPRVRCPRTNVGCPLDQVLENGLVEDNWQHCYFDQ